jgi:hypothetical protein
MLAFSGPPLEKAIAEANRYSSKKIRIGDPVMGGPPQPPAPRLCNAELEVLRGALGCEILLPS